MEKRKFQQQRVKYSEFLKLKVCAWTINFTFLQFSDVIFKLRLDLKKGMTAEGATTRDNIEIGN